MGIKAEESKAVLFSALSRNHQKLVLNSNGKKPVAECTGIIPNAIEIAKITPNGNPMIDMVIAGMNGRQDISLAR